MKQIYAFDGVVKYFDKVITNHYIDKTTAISPQQALNNICYKYKKKFGYLPNTKITLHGSLKVKGEDNYGYRT